MADGESIAGVILDPSVLFTEDALEWPADDELGPYLVVSQALWELLGNPEAGAQLEPFGVHPSPDEIGRVRDVFWNVGKFSHDGTPLPERALAVRDAILGSDEPLREIIADEWAFVASQSIAVLGIDGQKALDVWEKVGLAEVYRATNQEMARVLQGIRRRLPPGLLRRMKWVDKITRRVPRVVCLAGNIASLALPFLAVPLGIATAVNLGIGIIAGDP